MANINLPYVISDTDRHGNRRYYFRRREKGSTTARKIRLRGLPGSKEFMEAYQAATAGSQPKAKVAPTAQKGTFGYVCQRYYVSAEFRLLNKSTQSWRRRALDEVCRAHGDKPIARMEPAHVRRLRDEKADTPSASHNRLKALRALFRWATENDLAPHNPAKDVPALRYHSDGHHSWTSDEIRKFELAHPVGSMARLAMALMLFTGCRRADVVRLGPQHIQDGQLRYRQAKNEYRSPVDIDIPVHPELARIIRHTPCLHLTYLANDFGKPFTAAGFGNKFRALCNAAGLPHCSAHGLRKATATRLAEAGASSQEIMAITGHRSLNEVERYTHAASKPLLATSGMSKLKG
jgi:integrase